MHHHISSQNVCCARDSAPQSRRERGVLMVVLLTFAMMVIEIVAGYATHSMALLADGWHMATHVGALGIASLAYALSRRYASHAAFTFGTGKLNPLAGYTSALALGVIALAMIVESAQRLWQPLVIDFSSSLPVAVIGLIVNLASVWLLHDGHDHEHHHQHHHEPHHHHHHDHNHHAALMHVIADAFTSALAIAALTAGRYLHWSWLDPVSGIVGGLVILKWGYGLSKHAARELLDVNEAPALEVEVRSRLEAVDDVRVRDLHVWPLGGALKSCVVTLISSSPREPDSYRALLAPLGLAHVTIEVQRCSEGHAHG